MEPTIYKPSIYKGAGIYKVGAEGEGNSFIFNLDISTLDISSPSTTQNDTQILFTNNSNIEKDGNKLIIKGANFEIPIMQHVVSSTKKVEIKAKYNIKNYADYGYIGNKILLNFGSGNWFNNLAFALYTPGVSDIVTNCNYITGWSNYNRYGSFTDSANIEQTEIYVKGGTSKFLINDDIIASCKYSDDHVFDNNFMISAETINVIVELEKLQIKWS